MSAAYQWQARVTRALEALQDGDVEFAIDILADLLREDEEAGDD